MIEFILLFLMFFFISIALHFWHELEHKEKEIDPDSDDY